MKLFKRTFSLVLALTMALEVFGFVPKAESVRDVLDMGTAVSEFRAWGDNSAVTDGDAGTGLKIQRNRVHSDGAAWISVLVYDAGEEKTFDFNTISAINRAAVRYYGTNEAVHELDGKTYDLMDIYNTIDLDKKDSEGEIVLDDGGNPVHYDYSDGKADEERFPLCYGLEHIATIVNDTVTLDEPASYRYIVAVVGAGWTDAILYELELSMTQELAENRLVTFGEGISVTVDGAAIESGAEIAEGKELVIEASASDGMVVDAILVNGKAIEGNTFTVGGEDIEINYEAHTPAVVHKVIFDESIKVTANGVEISAGADVAEGTELEITYTVPSGERFKAILVNGEAIEGRIVTVGTEDIEITLETETVISGAASLGLPVYTYRFPNAELTTDGDEGTWSFIHRQNLGAPYISVAVYDAGEGNTFDFNRFTAVVDGKDFRAAICVSDSAEKDGHSLADLEAAAAEGYFDETKNYSNNIAEFTELFGLTPDFTIYGSDTYDLGAMKSGRYITFIVYGGWPTATVREISLSEAELADRTVSFDKNVKVSADGQEIESGARVKEGTVLKITPVLPENTILDTISVNGTAISGDSFTVGTEDITSITFTYTELDPYAVTLGRPVEIYNIPKGDPNLMTDGKLNTMLSFSRSKDGLENTWISVAVYDAGAGKSFDFSRIELVSGQNVQFYGANEAVNGEYNILDIKNTINKDVNYSLDGGAQFAEDFGLKHLGTFSDTFKVFGEQQSYRYFVVALSEGWQQNTTVSEITLSNKVYAVSVGQVVMAGGNEAVKSGQGAVSRLEAQYDKDVPELGALVGEAEGLTLWGWIGGSDDAAVSGAGTVTYMLDSDSHIYADVKLLGAAVTDERDYTVWVKGENGETSSAYTLASEGESVGSMVVYTVKNIEVFAGRNTVKIGSSKFAYAPDFAKAVFIDKTKSLTQLGEIVYANGVETDFGTLTNKDNYIGEFFPGLENGGKIDGLSVSSLARAEVAAESGEYNVLVLSGEGDIYVESDEAAYSAKTNNTSYSSVGGLKVTLIKNVRLKGGVSEIVVEANELAAFTVLPRRLNKVSFGDEITVIAGGIVNSGDYVPDAAELTISAFSSDGLMTDKIFVNGKEITGGRYTVFNEDVEISATFIEVMYVTVTFPDNITVLADGTAIKSGDRVPGDAFLRFVCRNSSAMQVIYSVNAVEIEGDSFTLDKESITVSAVLTPYDKIFLENYNITMLDETETALRYLLPRFGDYNSEITWTLEDSAKGDRIESYDEENFVLSVNMADNAYEAREVSLTAKINVGGSDYTVDKKVAAESHVLQDIGGRNFYIRPIGASRAELVMSNGQFAISGKGGDLWTAPDSFGYLYTHEDSEELTVSVKVDKTEGSNQWRRTGIMLRESTASGARFIMLDIGADNGAGLELAVRSSNNAVPYYVHRNTPIVKGKSSFGYLKLEKKGSGVNAYYSEDGVGYTLLNQEPVEFKLEEGYLAGLFTECESGYTYFSRFEYNGLDVLAADAVTNGAYEPADGKIKVTWNDPEEYSTRSFDSVVVTAENENGAVSACVPKGTQEAVLEGLENDSVYTVTITPKTALLCTESVNNATSYSVDGGVARLSALPIDAEAYAAAVAEIEISLSDEVMADEKNHVELSFVKPQPVRAYALEILLPEGVKAENLGLAEGVTGEITDGKITFSYRGSSTTVTEIGSFDVSASSVGAYELSATGAASYYSFEKGEIAGAKAKLAEATVNVVDVKFVTVTLGDGIKAYVDGVQIKSGAVVRGDAAVVLEYSVPENSELTYFVNGKAIEGNTVRLNREDVSISCDIVPYDVKYIREYELLQRTETEAGVLFTLPARGQYGSRITWTVNDNLFGDTITEVDYENALLTVDMAAGGYSDRSVSLNAAITFEGKTYNVEKTVFADTNIISDIGGIRFYRRQIGQDDQSMASLELTNDQMILGGYGTDLWNSPDSFGYLYTKSSDPDFTISVKVDRTQGNNQWRRTGIMFRQSDSENEKMIMLSLGSNYGKRLEYAYRVGTTGAASELYRNDSHGGVSYLKLEKKGNKFYAYSSVDGQEYTLLSETPATITMKGEYLVGLFNESNEGSAAFSRLTINGSDINVADNITNPAATASAGKIKLTWTDPEEVNGRSFEDIIVTATDGRKTSTITVPKGQQEAVIENLTNGVMYTVTLQARTALLCGADENGASSYRALSSPVTLSAFPVDVEYLGAVSPVIEMKASGSVTVGQSNAVLLSFESMQPVYKLDMSVEIPKELSVNEKNIKLSSKLFEAGGKAELKDGVLTITYSAEENGGIVYLTDIAQLFVSSSSSGTRTLDVKGSVTYYSFETGALTTDISDESTVSFKVKEAEKPSGGSSGGSTGAGSGNKKPNVSFGGFVTMGGENVPKTPDAADMFADKDKIPSWAYESVNRLTERNIIAGVKQGEELMFMPDADVTREQFVKLCATAFTGINSSASCSFTDVAPTDWYYPYVATMVEKGIVNGLGDGRFGVGEPISRQDMAVIIYKLHLSGCINLQSGPVTKFADSENIAGYALEAVTALRAAGVVNGYADNTFAPTDKVSRAMAAKVIFGCLN